MKEKNLIQYIVSKNYKIFALCQDNSSADKDIFLYWVDNVLLYNKYIPYNINKILILNRATTHYDDTLTVKLLKKMQDMY